jgi:hypothetical protein
MKKFISLLMVIAMFSCESNTYQEIEPKVALPTYQNEIRPIIEANCTSCHYQNSLLAPFSLTDYQSVKLSAEFGTLIYRIETATGQESMPLGLPKLSQSQIELIKLWAAQGFKN